MSFTSDKARDGIGDARDGEGGVGNAVASRGAGGDARLAGMTELGGTSASMERNRFGGWELGRMWGIVGQAKVFSCGWPLVRG
jgi:hypothetical protein